MRSHTRKSGRQARVKRIYALHANFHLVRERAVETMLWGFVCGVSVLVIRRRTCRADLFRPQEPTVDPAFLSRVADAEVFLSQELGLA